MVSGKSLVGRVKELRPLIVPLFRSVLRRADELAVALEVRCFDPYRFRRSAFGRRFGWGDASALACSACVLGLVRFVG
jgi:energy-coupling factor transport system permease protein